MLTHQTQPTPTSCTQTCLAMMLNVPVADVLKVYPNPMGQYDIIRAIGDCKIPFNVISLGHIWFQGKYTACVPSLNNPGVNHQIILDVDFDHEDGYPIHVFDPNDGREGAKVYSRNGSNLRSWTDLIRFEVGGKLPKNENESHADKKEAAEREYQEDRQKVLDIIERARPCYEELEKQRKN